MRPVPYTTPAGIDKAAAGPARGSGRTAAGLVRGVPARRPGDGDDRGDRLGGHGCLPQWSAAPASGRRAADVFKWPVGVFKRCPFWGLLTGFGVRGGT